MKRKLMALLVSFTLLVITAVPALAVMEAGDQYAFISDEEVIDDDLFIAAEEVIIEGIVNGDVFVAGAKVRVTGTINGDLYAAAGILDVSGVVGQDIIAVADTITLDRARVDDGMITAGNVIFIDEDSTLAGGLIYAASSMNMNGSIGRGILGASGTTSMDGSVEKNMVIATEEFNVSSNAQINGDLKFVAEEGTTVDDSRVGGSIEQIERSHREEVMSSESSQSLFASFTHQLMSYLSALMVGALILAFIPKFYRRVGKEVVEHPLMGLVYGLVFVLVTPFVAMMIMLTIVGLPLSLLILVKYFVIMYLGKIFAAAILSAALLKWTKWKWLKKGNEYFVFAMMLLLFFFLKNLPAVGSALNMLILLVAWGGMSVAGVEMTKALKKAKW